MKPLPLPSVDCLEKSSVMVPNRIFWILLSWQIKAFSADNVTTSTITEINTTSSTITEGNATSSRVVDGNTTSSTIIEDNATSSRVVDGNTTSSTIIEGNTKSSTEDNTTSSMVTQGNATSTTTKKGNATSSTIIENLLKNYHSILRPVCEEDITVQVKIGLAIRQIIDLNEPRQILETNAWIRLTWKDCHLKWDAKSTGIDNLVVPYGTIWVPDITLYDNAENELGGLKEFRQEIMHDGTINYNFPTIIKSLCKVDVTFFPFDVQVCRFKFGSWMHHGFDLNLSMSAKEDGLSGDISIYRSNGEWSILGAPAIRHVFLYQCCVEPYPDVTFYLQLQRKPLFYLLNLLFPCTVISTVAILSFLLPPESGEKVSLCITVLLSLAVFLLVVSETMPPTSETFPFIGLYFASCMLLVSVSCLMTVTVLNFHHKGNHGRKVPWLVRKIILDCFGRILCTKTTYYGHGRYNNMHQEQPEIQVIENHNSCQSTRLPKDITDHENNLYNTLRDLKELNTNHNRNVIETSMEVITILHKQLENLRNLTAHSDSKKHLEERVGEWQLVAKVVDRIFFLLFLCIQVGTTVGILVRISTADKFTPLE